MVSLGSEDDVREAVERAVAGAVNIDAGTQGRMGVIFKTDNRASRVNISRGYQDGDLLDDVPDAI